MFDFPSAPTVGQTYTPAGGPTYVYNGTAWVVLSPGSNFATTVFTATLGQTTFSVSYTVGAIYVYRNGVLLAPADFTATNGTTVVLANACNAGDTVEIISLAQVPYVNAVQKTGDTMTGTLNLPTNGLVVGTNQLVAASGNIGIGTSSPDAILTVSKASTSTTIGGSTAITKIINSQSSSLGETSGIEFFNRSTTGSAKLAGVYGVYTDFNSTGYGGALVFATEAAGGSNVTERLRIDSSGNVGIGTTNAAGHRLVVSDVSRIRWGVTTADVTEITTNAAQSAYASKLSDALSYVWSTSGSERVRINTAGTFCVNTTAAYASSYAAFRSAAGGIWPLEALGVDRGTAYRMTSNSGFALYFETNNGTSVAGNITTTGTTTSFVTSSDYRLKEDAKPIQNALNDVMALKPVTFTWKHDNSSGEGFIAHELQAVKPLAVIGDKDAVDAEGKPIYQGVDPSKLVATLTKAIQEQQSIIEDLKARVAQLEGAN